MKPSILLVPALLVGLAATPGLLAQTQQQERVYGSELMTERERTEYREKMRSLHTEQERAALRAEHHEAMRQRAESMGKQLPDQPPASHGQQQRKSTGSDNRGMAGSGKGQAGAGRGKQGKAGKGS